MLEILCESISVVWSHLQLFTTWLCYSFYCVSWHLVGVSELRKFLTCVWKMGDKANISDEPQFSKKIPCFFEACNDIKESYLRFRNKIHFTLCLIVFFNRFHMGARSASL